MSDENSNSADEYVPPKVWEWDNESGGRFANINRPIIVTRVVYVVADQTAPVITVTGAADTTIEVGTAWVDLPAVAIDNKEGNISDAIVVSGEVDVWLFLMPPILRTHNIFTSPIF